MHTHAAPLGLWRREIPFFYTHIAPLGLKYGGLPFLYTCQCKAKTNCALIAQFPPGLNPEESILPVVECWVSLGILDSECIEEMSAFYELRGFGGYPFNPTYGIFMCFLVVIRCGWKPHLQYMGDWRLVVGSQQRVTRKRRGWETSPAEIIISGHYFITT